MTSIQLRPYQKDGLNALWSYFADGNKGNPLLAWPTGVGKTIIPAEFIQQTMARWPNQRFLMITHVSTLIKQNAEVMRYIWPNAPLGIYSAGLNQKQSSLPIVFGGIQSMVKHPQLFGWRDIIFIDEAHLVSQDDASMYLSFIATMRLINPNLKVIGMTATPFRMGQGMLTDGGLFTDIVHDLTSVDNFNKLIADGYLAPLVPRRTKTELDVSNVGMNKYDYIGSQLQSAVDKAEITYAGLQELVHYGHDRRSWLIFASGIEHSEHIADMLGHFGVQCAAVHSKKNEEYNVAAINAHKNGSLRAISNYGKLTTGYNNEAVDLIGMFRPTMSIPLHIQMLGRGTRPCNGKKDCIAEGSLVLTNTGLVPIEKISLEMKVWDGVEFVSHSGVICQGYKEVIEYHGLVATMDHKVYTKKGWQTFGECRERKIRIAITGKGKLPIRQIKNYFTSNKVRKEKIQNSSSMYAMFNYWLERLSKCYSVKSRMQKLWNLLFLSSKSPEMALCSVQCCEGTLYQSERSSIQRLWWSRNKIQFFFSNGNGLLDNKQSWFTSTFRNRQNREQFTLRNWKLKIFNKKRKHSQPENISSKSTSLQSRFVFDILNCGPRNRFTVNNLLVSNCLVLDYARNVPRLGPINDPIIPKKKSAEPGDLPVKICEACGTYNHLKVRFCTNCGNEFHFQVKIVPKSGNEEILRSDFPIVESFIVDRAVYNRRQKDGKPAYIRTTYFCGFQAFHENLFPEGRGYGKHLFHQWWMQRHTAPPPVTADEALEYKAQFRTPKRIRVHVNKQFPEIKSVEF